ncbi:hypothetical protein TL16_g04597 [Triparma laevis f. inornata]|uniref:ABC-2 type transporter transmembrane domain-containing protein n=1 Tax=Triparma laevis f. inornata TaxID=1714386 RepID=A0A9W7AB79_9STRA|nr:hypothetical protein TL16_g04597 [Triparma laevis f. inornata]
MTEAFRKREEKLTQPPTPPTLSNPTPWPRLPIHRRLGVLISRSFKQNIRDTTVNALRLSATCLLSFIFSNIFSENLSGPPNAKSVADRTALLSYAVINMSMMGLMKTLDLFGREKPVVMRERMKNHYGGMEYLIAKIIAEIPMDCSFSVAFAFLLKKFTNLNISLKR